MLLAVNSEFFVERADSTSIVSMAAVSPEAIAPCLCCCPLLAHSEKGVLCPLSLMVRLRTPALSYTRSTLTPPYFRTGSASFPLKQSRCDDDLILGCYFCVQNAITLFKQHTLKSLNCTPAPHYEHTPNRTACWASGRRDIVHVAPGYTCTEMQRVCAILRTRFDHVWTIATRCGSIFLCL